MIFDTDVLIWVLRGHEKAAALVDATEPRRIALMSYLELIQGARDRREQKTIKDFLAAYAFQLLPLSENIGHRAATYLEQYALKVAMGPGDALVAATAVETHLPLCTANQKHYRPIAELDLRLFRP